MVSRWKSLPKMFQRWTDSIFGCQRWNMCIFGSQRWQMCFFRLRSTSNTIGTPPRSEGHLKVNTMMLPPPKAAMHPTPRIFVGYISDPFAHTIKRTYARGLSIFDWSLVNSVQIYTGISVCSAVCSVLSVMTDLQCIIHSFQAIPALKLKFQI